MASGLASVVRRRRWCRCGAVIDGVRVRLLSSATAAAVEPLSTTSGLLGAAMKEPTYHGWKSAWLADALVVLHACTYIQAHLYSYMCSNAAAGRRAFSDSAGRRSFSDNAAGECGCGPLTASMSRH